MEVVKLPDGEIEVIGRKQHIIDIVRERCGDDVAKIISEWIDPEELDIDDFEFDKQIKIIALYIDKQYRIMYNVIIKKDTT